MEEKGRRVFPRWVVTLATVALVGWILFVLRGVLTPVFFAFFIAYMLDPVVDRFEAWKLPRSVGIVVVLTLALGAIGVFLLLVVPPAIADAREFARELPLKWAGLQRQLEPMLLDLGVELPHSMSELIEQVSAAGAETSGEEAGGSGELLGMAGQAAGPVGAALKWVVGGTASALGAIAGLIMVPVLAFYLLHDFDRIIATIRELVPGRYRPFVVDVAKEVDQVLSQFIRGQVTVMIILAVLYAAGYSFAGIRLAVVIGIIAGLLSFIPYVGGALALGLALLMCALDFGGWGQVGWVVGVYVVIQLLEGFVITPKIVGDKIGLAAVWVLLALMVGGEVFGFMGVLLALPAAAVGKIFVIRALAWYRKSSAYLGDGDDASRASDPDDSALAGILHEEGLPDDAALAAAKVEAEGDDEDDEDDDEVDQSIEDAVRRVAESQRPPPQDEREDDHDDEGGSEPSAIEVATTASVPAEAAVAAATVTSDPPPAAPESGGDEGASSPKKDGLPADRASSSEPAGGDPPSTTRSSDD